MVRRALFGFEKTVSRKISALFLRVFFGKKKQKDVFRTNRTRFFPTDIQSRTGGRNATEQQQQRLETPRERETMNRRRTTETIVEEEEVEEEEDRRRAESAETPSPFTLSSFLH